MTTPGVEGQTFDRAEVHLGGLRAELDRIDPQLIELLGRRFEIARLVAGVKATNDIPVMQHDRVRVVKERNARLGSEAGLDPAFVERLFGLIIDEMCRVEDAIVDGG